MLILVKFLVLLIAITSTAFFMNDKFSKAVRVIAFKEDEDEIGAKRSFILMLVISLSWSIYFAIF